MEEHARKMTNPTYPTLKYSVRTSRKLWPIPKGAGNIEEDSYPQKSEW
jgi:hypothetical protein